MTNSGKRLTAPASAPRHLPNSGGNALAHVRPQIQDLSTDSIAELARLAGQLGGVIPLWYGEGDMVTPAFIGDAAKRAIGQGLTFYIPDMRGYQPLIEALSTYQSRVHGVAIAQARKAPPCGLVAIERLAELAAALFDGAEVQQRVALAVQIAGGASGGERALEHLSGLFVVAAAVSGQAGVDAGEDGLVLQAVFFGQL